MTAPWKTDYLVVGAGAMGMAFTDELSRRTGKSVVLVDRLDRPGGHWNHAYPFVRLHQPSSFYGVNSRELGSGKVDEIGRNRGMQELASVQEILAYFDQLMRQDFLPTGRVRYLPLSEFLGEGRVRSLATGEETVIDATKTVDATYMNVKVPQTQPPKFPVADGVECMPPNALARLDRVYPAFVVIGGGKTGIDTCLYLLDLGVAPERITWIVPRTSWLIDRAEAQPDTFPTSLLAQVAAIAGSTSREDLFARVEACRGLVRLDPEVEPSMYRCATVSQEEIADLRKIRDVVRLGRVTSLEPGRIVLERGEREFAPGTLFLNCTADGLEKRPSRPVFEGARITLQALRPCQQTFAAALLGFVEATYDDDALKNQLCPPTPHPDTDLDYLRMVRDTILGQLRWAGDPTLRDWLRDARLDGFTSPELAELLASAYGPSPAPEVAVVKTALGKIEAYLGADDRAAV